MTEEELTQEDQSGGILKLKDKIAAETRDEKVILPLRDGMTHIRKK